MEKNMKKYIYIYTYIRIYMCGCIHITESLCCTEEINTTLLINCQFSSVTQLRLTLWGTPGLPVHHQLQEFTQTHVHWVGDLISSSVIPFSSCLQSFPASGSFPKSQLFTSGGQSIGVSASASVLPMNIQDWFPLGWTGWISCSPRDSQESS